VQRWEYDRLYALSAAAKINLRLKIVGRREDGYHLLSMLNTLIDLCDRLELSLHKNGRNEVEVSGPEAKNFTQQGENTVLKALRLFFEAYAIDAAASVKLEKNIPIGAGLGGGSSDAAAVLLFLTDFFHDQYSKSSIPLEAVAAKVGSDVPYFLHGGLALVEGVGEKILELPFSSLEKIKGVLLIPDQRISTPKAFALYREKHPTIPVIFDETLAQYGVKSDSSVKNKEMSYSTLLSLCENDLKESACQLSSQVDHAFKLFSDESGYKIFLTGSGSAMFVLSSNQAQSPLDFVKNRLREGKVNFLQIIPFNLLAKFVR
jgi:4-diphosphocytidyl-2-C-methyl-D-erythritol kinase